MSASTQNQALSALLVLYREVLQQPLPWLDNVIHARQPARLPVVLTREAVQAILAHLQGTSRLTMIEMQVAGTSSGQALTPPDLAKSRLRSSFQPWD